MTLKELVKGNENAYNRFMEMAKHFWSFGMYNRLDGAILVFIEMFRGDTTLNSAETNRLAFEILNNIQN